MALEGSLRDMTLVDLIQVFHTWPKTGFLLLTQGSERGVIYIAVGRMVDAVVVRYPNRQIIAGGEGAVLRLLQWDDAIFSFRHNPAALQRPVRITHDSTWFLQQGQRCLEQKQLISQPCITLDTRLELAPLPTDARSTINLGLEQWRLLSQLTHRKNLRELCQHTGAAPERALHIARELAAIGLIEVIVNPSPPVNDQRTNGGCCNHALERNRMSGRTSTAVTRTRSSVPERGLLNAVMRRIRAL